MAASVRVEDEAFADRRYNRLARLAGLADADHARGKLLVLWRQCTIENREDLPVDDVLDVLGENGVDALVRSNLGEALKGDRVRIKGTRGRIEWLQKLRENGKKGGRPKKNQKVPEGETNEETKRKPLGSENQNPPAPAPAPAPTERESGSAAASALALAAVEELNKLTGRNFSAEAKTTLDDAKRLAKDKVTPEQVRAVVLAKYREWASDHRMCDQLKPSVLLRPSNFHKYLAEDVQAGKAKRQLIPTTDDTGLFDHIDNAGPN